MLLCSLDEKARLLDSGEAAYYTTPHYDGYGSILVHLELIDREALRELIVQAWQLKAPRTVRAAFDAARTGLLPPPATPRAPRRPRPRPRKARRP